MIEKVECVMLECDNCKETYESSGGFAIFPDELSIKNEASDDEWLMHEKDGKHLCPLCYKYDDNDVLIIDESRKKQEEYVLPAKDTGLNFGEQP